jgi:hypothetical protein
MLDISHLLSHICHLLSAICCLLSAFALGADDVVTVQWSKRENPSREALFSANATLGNAKAMWSSSLSNMRAHGANGRHLQYSVVSGKTSGFCGLISSLGLTVNGIDWRKLQVNPENVSQWKSGDADGFEFTLNFDGAPVRIRTWMEPESPLLQFEISGSTNGLRTVTNMTVRVSAIPSFLDCGNGKPTRFFGYRRQIGTERRLMAPRKLGSEKLDGTERLFVFEDADYDGSAEDRGKGSSAVILNEPARGQASINDSWTGEIHFWPNPSKPFRFALLDMAHVRIDNEAFFKKASEMLCP